MRSLLLLLVALVGCSSEVDSPAGFDAGGAGVCEAPRAMCGSRCVNLESDPYNCGACGETCAAGSYCSESACGRTCASGLVACGGACADPSRDPDHCGGCDQACAADEVCEGGACRCGGGRTDCGGSCIDTDTDRANCGLCGRACGAGEDCVAGSCRVPAGDAGAETDAGSAECPSGTHACGAECVADMANDPDNGCRTACAATPCPVPDMATATCTSEGTCDFECTGPATRVGDHCEAAGCTPDGAEDNDTQATAYALAGFTDAPDTSMTFASFGLHSDADVDWYRFAVTDAGYDGNPIVRVVLDSIPSGSDYELGAWYRCDAGTTTTVTCNTGTAGSLGAYEGCTSTLSGTAAETVELDTDCSGTDESGIVLVRVESYAWSGACDDYRFTVEVR